MAEREVAALLSDLESLALNAAAQQAAACAARPRSPRRRRKKRKRAAAMANESSDGSDSSGDDSDGAPPSSPRAPRAPTRTCGSAEGARRRPPGPPARRQCVQALVNRDDAALRKRCAGAAQARIDADMILTKVKRQAAEGVGGSRR